MAAKGKEKKRKDVHETFDEKDDVLFIIGSLKEAHKDMIKLERAIEKFTCTYFDIYLIIEFCPTTILSASNNYCC